MPSSDLQSIITDLSDLLTITPTLTRDWADVARWCEHKITLLSPRAAEPDIGPIIAALEQAVVALHKAIGDHSSGEAGLSEVHRVGSWWIAETQATGIPPTGGPPAHWTPSTAGPPGGQSKNLSPGGSGAAGPPLGPRFRLGRVVTRPGGFSVPNGGYLTAEDLITGFDPARDANLPAVTHEEAKKYLDAHRTDRPWLDFSHDPHPDLDHPGVLRALVAIDQGSGHPLSRHEGFAASNDRLRLRVAALEDPAQTDLAKRLAGVDAFKSGSLSHVCQTMATTITDPIAFLAAYIHATKHPAVRAVLDSAATTRPLHPIRLPINDLLGAKGHGYCDGTRLIPINDLSTARKWRRTWIRSGRPANDPLIPSPATSVINDFSRGDVIIQLGEGSRGQNEIRTLYVEP